MAVRSVVTHIDSADQFNKIVATQEKLIVVDYYADWCIPCKRMKPVFDRLSDEFEDKCQFVAIDIDKNSDLANALEIRSIPTFDFIKKKKLLNRMTGELPKELEQRVFQFANDTNDNN